MGNWWIRAFHLTIRQAGLNKFFYPLLGREEGGEGPHLRPTAFQGFSFCECVQVFTNLSDPS